MWPFYPVDASSYPLIPVTLATLADVFGTGWLFGWLVACLVGWLKLKLNNTWDIPVGKCWDQRLGSVFFFHPNILSIHSEITH